MPRTTTPAREQAARPLRVKARKPHVTLGVRIGYHTNERLTHANHITGLGVSGIVEQALNAYFDWLGIPPNAQAPRNPDGTLPRRERTAKKRTRRHRDDIDDVLIGPRISPQTNERLTVACLNTATGPKDILEDALRAWFLKNAVPLYEHTPGERRRTA